MPTLFSWYLKKHGSVFLGHGIVSGHPKLEDGERIHTSPILDISESEGSIRVKTRSGSIYHLRPEELNVAVGKENVSFPPPEELGLPSDFWSRCVQARDRALEKEATASRRPGTLRLRLVGTTALSALWYGTDGPARRLPRRVNVGMFQDSVLFTDCFETASGLFRVDFRYFPCRNRIEPYQISAGIDTILIVNEGCQDIHFGGLDHMVLCPAAESTEIPASMMSGQV